MKYIIGIVALGLIVLDVVGFSISPFSYGVFGLASLVLIIQKGSKIKKAKAFGVIELEFENETQKLIDNTIEVSNEILENKRIKNKKRKPKNLDGLSGTKKSKSPEIRLMIVPELDTRIDEKSDELLTVVQQLHSLSFSDSSKPLSNMIKDFREINFKHESYLRLLEQFIELKDIFSGSSQLYDKPLLYKRMNFVVNQLINFTKELIEGTETRPVKYLN